MTDQGSDILLAEMTLPRCVPSSAAAGLRVAVGAVLAVAHARGVWAGEAGGHAAELETSLTPALAPDLVSTAAMTEPRYTGPLDDAAAVLFDAGVGALAANGVLGDPAALRAAPARLRHRLPRRDRTPTDDATEADRVSDPSTSQPRGTRLTL